MKSDVLKIDKKNYVQLSQKNVAKGLMVNVYFWYAKEKITIMYHQ